MMFNRLIGATGVALLLFAGITPLAAQQAADAVQPESTTENASKTTGSATKYMVAAANRHAAEAGLEVLRAGGSAADALIAVQTVLGLVEPQSSGLGGGAFLVYYDAGKQALTTFDGRETAPRAAKPSLFLDADGKPLKFFEAVIGGRAVGVPGTVRLMEAVHKRHGKLEWKSLFSAAAELARDGFAVSPRLNALVTYDKSRLSSQDASRSYFFDSAGSPLAVGTTLKNPDYAKTIETIAANGADAFYSGKIAQDIVDTVRNHVGNPGLLTVDDFTAYEAKEREAVCISYREHDVCGMGPPSSGAQTIGQILGVISHFDLESTGPKNPESWRIIGDASRLAFADRGRYIADSDFVKIPQGLLDPVYLADRAKLLRRRTALGKADVSAGTPPWKKAELRIDGLTFELPSTSHFVIVDEAGNIASMTSSIENGFGSRLMTGGFLLNNQLTDFSFLPSRDGQAVANKVESGKRPRSSMSPTIILKDGKPVHALGSPGGSRIIPYVAKTIIALIDWKMTMQDAVELPHLVNRFGEYDIESDTDSENLALSLQTLGYQTKFRDLNSGLHGISIHLDRLVGGADPRREGVAIGD